MHGTAAGQGVARVERGCPDAVAATPGLNAERPADGRSGGPVPVSTLVPEEEAVRGPW